MESCSVSKKNKRSKRHKPSEGQDIVSNLPDFIIGHILSFLPTKLAVRTSVLSKRWTYLWTFITKLSFEDKERRDWNLYYTFKDSKKIKKTCFLNFVNRVLLHLNSSSLQSFSLVISEKYNPSHINDWISAVLNRRVKKLCVDSLKELTLSSHVFLKSQSLEELVLKMKHCCVIKVPSSVRLLSLTVLELTKITFNCYSFNVSNKLTLNFPLLRKYETKDCTWSGVKSVTLNVPLLEVLSIEYSPLSQSAESNNAEIKFCASRLIEFRYYSRILPETLFIEARIVSANIALSTPDEKSVQETDFNRVCKLLNSNNAECLKLRLLNQEVLLSCDYRMTIEFRRFPCYMSCDL